MSSNEYFPTIGLEIHAELHTKSKMWCGCINDPFVGKPNVNICEVCMAHPGTLPVPNKEAIKKTIQVGLSLGSNIADFTEFDRKNYFYPDIPKGYQISQYKLPIVSGGNIDGIEITRIHLEEDTAKSSHDNDGYTLVDFNRAGVPLMELVTEPVIHNAKDAGNFARELQRILRYVGASEANMEMGQMRVEANVSISKNKPSGNADKNNFGTKCEVKNLNSFRSVEEAIEYEIERQSAILDEGGVVVQETRGWDENKQETFSQRKKENAHDYRYFPDPDLPKMYLSELFDIEELRKEIPLLPSKAREKLNSLCVGGGISEILIDNIEALKYFFSIQPESEIFAEKGKFAQISFNYLVTDIFGLLKKENKELSINNFPSISSFRTLIEMIITNELSSRGAKDILVEMLSNKNLDVRKFAEEKGLIQKNDTEALKKIVNEVIADNTDKWNDFKNGNEKLLMFFVGQCMKKSSGSGNPQMFQEIIKSV